MKVSGTVVGMEMHPSSGIKNEVVVKINVNCNIFCIYTTREEAKSFLPGQSVYVEVYPK